VSTGKRPRGRPKGSGRARGRGAAPPEELIELPDAAFERALANELIVEYDPAHPSTRSVPAVRSAGSTIDTVVVATDWYEARDALASWHERRDREVGPRSVSAEQRASRVHGVGIGFKMTADTLTGELAVKVYVAEKLPEHELSDRLIVPRSIEGMPTDVEAIGEVIPFSYAFHFDRAVRCGVSVGHRLVTAGTLGCLVVLDNNHLAILSNNHVLANNNKAQSGDAILQAGVADGGVFPQDTIGVLESFVPLSASAANLVDAAVAHTSFRHVEPRHVTYTLDPNPITPALGTTVLKNGRTTQATLGTITDIGINLSVPYAGIGPAPFKDQIGIRGIGAVFSRPGDSGSLIVTANSKQPVALLFAGTGDNTLTLANPISAVIEALHIKRFVTKHPA
jgi:hypothetical protein